MRQLSLNVYKGKHGGRRPNCGRKRLHSPGVAHRTREKVSQRHALHVNFKVRSSIRNKTCLKILKRAIFNSRRRGLRVLHYALESNHVHLILEAQSNQTLTRGMRSLTITFAKGIKRGRIQLERYHLHVLRSLRETKNAIHYVLFNHQKHRKLKRAEVNEYTSLGPVHNLRQLAQEAKFTIVLKKLQEVMTLDNPKSWAAKVAISQGGAVKFQHLNKRIYHEH